MYVSHLRGPVDEIAVNHVSHEEPYVALGNVFSHAKHLLTQHARKFSSGVKHHSEPASEATSREE